MMDQLKKETKNFEPALYIDKILPFEFRLNLTIFFGIVAFALLGLLISKHYMLTFSLTVPFVKEIVDPFKEQIIGVGSYLIGSFFLFISIWLILMMLNAYYYSVYFKGLSAVVGEKFQNKFKPLITFESAEAVYLSGQNILTDGFVKSKVGKLALLRLGIGPNTLKKALESRNGGQVSLGDSLFKEGIDIFTFKDLASKIFEKDELLNKFILSSGVSKEEFLGASEWAERDYRDFKKSKRWWGRDLLGKIPGVGKDWSYGGAYRLQKYCRDITNNYFGEDDEGKKEISELEAVLSKSREANALLVSESGEVGAMDEIKKLCVKISDGSAEPMLEHKRAMLFNGSVFVSSNKEKIAFENELIKVMRDAEES
ncbi:MAG: hypothetical protein WCT19_04600, partial [Candidatus Paceibacterota bacterium]